MKEVSLCDLGTTTAGASGDIDIEIRKEYCGISEWLDVVI